MPHLRVIGLGLIGGSLALAARERGWAVSVEDVDAAARAWAQERALLAEGDPDLIVVAVDPQHTTEVVRRALVEHPQSIVADVCSVKRPVFERVLWDRARSRYVGLHPMAGSHVGGRAGAHAQLLLGARWAWCPSEGEAANARVAELLDALDAEALVCTPILHDEVVAATSHVPHLLAALAATHAAAHPTGARLHGGGLDDLTRIASSPSPLWQQIVAANDGPIRALLHEIRAEIDTLLASRDLSAGASVLMHAGRLGRARSQTPLHWSHEPVEKLQPWLAECASEGRWVRRVRLGVDGWSCERGDQRR